MNKVFIYTLLTTILLSGCAIQKMPSGGEKDTTLPSLLKAIPANESKNIDKLDAELQFDEFISLENIAKELIISPIQENKPEIKVKGKKLIIHLNDSILPNTTYSIRFGNAIKDITEGNVVSNFTYVFCTGEELDSLSISGAVIENMTKKPVKEVKILLYKNYYDSIVYKDQPDYYSRTDEQGKYTINYLAPGKYFIFCLGDKNENLLYDPGEIIGFRDKEIILSSDTVLADIETFKENPKEIKVVDARNSGYYRYSMMINRKLLNPRVFSLTTKTDQYAEYRQDSLIIWAINDSLNKEFVLLEGKTVVDTFEIKNTVKKEQVKIEAINDITLSGKYSITFNAPVKSFDTGQMLFLKDTILFKNYTGISTGEKSWTSVKLDSVPPRGKTNFILLLPGCVTNIYDKTNDTIKLPIRVSTHEELGTIRLNISDSMQNNKIIQLTDAKFKVLRFVEIQGDGVCAFENLKPGNYQVRIVIDENNNGIWDTGNYGERKQPERVIIYEKVLGLKANWEIEENIIIPAGQ